MGTTAMVKRSNNDGITEAEFDRRIKKLEIIFANIASKLEEAGKLLASMSFAQIKRVKNIFREIMSAERIDRLILIGQGQMSEWFALNVPTIKSKVFRALPRDTKEVLNNPTESITIALGKRITTKRVQDLSPAEIHHVIDPQRGLLDVHEQIAKYQKLPEQKINRRRLPIFDGMRKVAGGMEIHWRFQEEQPGSRTFTTFASDKDVKNIAAGSRKQ